MHFIVSRMGGQRSLQSAENLCASPSRALGGGGNTSNWARFHARIFFRSGFETNNGERPFALAAAPVKDADAQFVQCVRANKQNRGACRVEWPLFHLLQIARVANSDNRPRGNGRRTNSRSWWYKL